MAEASPTCERHTTGTRLRTYPGMGNVSYMHVVLLSRCANQASTQAFHCNVRSCNMTAVGRGARRGVTTSWCARRLPAFHPQVSGAHDSAGCYRQHPARLRPGFHASVRLRSRKKRDRQPYASPKLAVCTKEALTHSGSFLRSDLPRTDQSMRRTAHHAYKSRSVSEWSADPAVDTSTGCYIAPKSCCCQAQPMHQYTAADAACCNSNTKCCLAK